MAKKFMRYRRDQCWACSVLMLNCLVSALTFVFVCGFGGTTNADNIVSCSDKGAKQRPNIVMIIADDQLYSDFGFMGNGSVRTPNLDELASQAAIYTDAYVPSSVCRPSLATLLTGLYPHQHGVHFNHPPPGFAKLTRSPQVDQKEFDRLRGQAEHLIRNRQTLPRILASRGYRCFQTGKHWEGHWKNAGFTEGMTIAKPSGGRYGDKQLANGDWVAHGNGDRGLAIGRETMQPIEAFLDDVQETPFLLWYAPFMPHTPHDSPAKFKRAVAADAGVEAYQIPYYSSIMHFDETVGDLIRMIDQRGMRDKTLFVFVSDNGWEPDPERFRKSSQEWDHTRRSKRSPFEPGLRTPVLLHWRGHTRPAKHTGLVNTIDLLPTLLDAADVQVKPDGLPGISLWPSAIGTQMLSDERAVFGEIYPGDASSIDAPEDDIAYRWIRKGKYKLITPASKGRKSPWNNYLEEPALFDLMVDPEEKNNLHGDPGHAEVVASLMEALNRWWSP